MKEPLCILGALLFGGILLSLPLKGQQAQAKLINARGETVGIATLKSASQGVKISLKVRHLRPGIHAIHIHAIGKCEPPGFKSAGPHFNPFNKMHGARNPEGAHAGDLPNFKVSSDGSARLKVVVKGVTLGDGENSLLREGGTALVIHQGADDEMTDPAGNAGPRIACGVITAVE